MPVWVRKCLCLVAVVGLVDGHLLVAQSWAWLTMLQDRAPEQGVVEALDSTFSGDAPCPMCCAIQEERQEKQEQAPIPESEPMAKYPPVDQNAAIAFFPPKYGFQARKADSRHRLVSWCDSPLSPPPQV